MVSICSAWKALAYGYLALSSVARYASAGTSVGCGPSSRYVVGYYPSWKRSSLLDLDWRKLTHAHVAFGIPTDDGAFTFDGEWFMHDLVRDAHRDGVKVSISIGGWTGSNRFSTIMRDLSKRAVFIKSITEFVDKYDLDGVDIDWEYPGMQGSKCNKYDPAQDTPNFMRFLRALRADMHVKFPDIQKLISLALHVKPFPEGRMTMHDVSAIAQYVDYASIMAFDINGSWSNTTGPNAPLEHLYGHGPQFSLSQAIDDWLGAKWPAEKLLAGVPFYGRSLTTREVATAKDGAEMYMLFDDKKIPRGDKEDAKWYDVCENTNTMSGVWLYRHLRDQGVLRSPNTTNEEWVRVWDKKTSTPWAYNPTLKRFISYDDPDSIKLKVDYAKSKSLKGVMAWYLNGDYNNELLNVLDSVGPLCRGDKTDTDPTESSESSSSSSATSMSSSWTPTPPFASLIESTPTESSSSKSLNLPDYHSWHPDSPVSDSSSASDSPTPSDSSSLSPADSNNSSISSASSSSNNNDSQSSLQPSSTSDASASSPLDTPAQSSDTPAQSSTTPMSPDGGSASPTPSATSKAILFDSQGVPYVMANGKSSSLPQSMASMLINFDDSTTTEIKPTASTMDIGGTIAVRSLLVSHPMPVDMPISESVSARDKPEIEQTPIFSSHMTSLPLLEDWPTKLAGRTMHTGLNGAYTNIFETPMMTNGDDNDDPLGPGSSQTTTTDEFVGMLNSRFGKHKGMEIQSSFSSAVKNLGGLDNHDLAATPSGFAATFFLPLDSTTASSTSDADVVEMTGADAGAINRVQKSPHLRSEPSESKKEEGEPSESKEEEEEEGESSEKSKDNEERDERESSEKSSAESSSPSPASSSSSSS